MKILIACLHHATCTGRFLNDAFKRLGHNVRHIGGKGQVEANIKGWTIGGPFDAYWPDWKPDLVIYAETAYKPWHHEGYRDVPHVSVCSCNNVVNMRNEPPLDANLPYAHYFLAHRDSVAWPVKEDDESWLPCAHDPTFHTPSRISFEGRPYDVALLGAPYKRRTEWMEAFEKRGFNVLYDQLYGYDYTIGYHRAKISLCISPYQSPMMRFFETAAMGCLIMGDYCKEFHDLNPVAQGFLYPETVHEAMMMAEYYINHPKQAEGMINYSMAWAKKHTWDARAQQIIDWYTREYET